MRFLIDAQLPPKLAQIFKSAGHVAEHVYDVGLANADDTAIWKYADSNEAVLITKDEDFSMFLQINPSKISIVWIRLGNCPNKVLFDRLKTLLDEILSRLQQGERLIEIV
jgi:predicted nuclease of predicted toxin-antitoxin system